MPQFVYYVTHDHGFDCQYSAFRRALGSLGVDVDILPVQTAAVGRLRHAFTAPDETDLRLRKAIAGVYEVQLVSRPPHAPVVCVLCPKLV